MKFKPGDRVVFLSEQGGGVIQSIVSATMVCLLDDMGFERNYPIKSLALVRSEDIPVDEHKLKQKPQEETTKTSKKQLKNQVYKIDLHIDELISDNRGMTNHEKLQLQLNHFIKAFNYCAQKRIKRLQVIHGVGEGVLRAEIHHYLRQFSGTEFHDMSYTRNGFGGTEVILCFKELGK